MSIKTLSPRVKNFLIFALIAFTLFAAYQLYPVIAPFLIALVCAYLVNPIVNWLESKKLPRVWAIVLLYLFAFVLTFLVLVPAVITISNETLDLFRNLEAFEPVKLITQAKDGVKSANNFLSSKLLEIPWAKDHLDKFLNSPKLQEVLSSIILWTKDTLLAGGASILSMSKLAFSKLYTFIMVPILLFYILLDINSIFASFIKLIPKAYRFQSVGLFSKIDVQLSSLLRGQFLSNGIFAIIMTLLLLMTGLKYSFFLGPFAGIANFIPYLGGLATFVLAFLVALIQFAFTKAFAIALLKLIIAVAIAQGIEGWILQPKIVGDQTRLHPLIILLALTLAGSFAGITGMLLAMPVTVILKVLFEELYDMLYEE